MTTLSKILQFLEWLSVLIGHICVLLVVAMFFTALFGPIIGSLAGIIAGVAKEYFDKWRGRKFDWWDIGADILGVILGVLIVVKYG